MPENIKVCHMTSVHKRYDVRIFQKECTSLAEAGYDVSLVVSDDQADEERNGVHIRSTQYVPKNRLERMRKSTKQVYKTGLLLNADLYHLHDPELLRIAKKLKRKGKRVVFDAHEDTQEQIKDKTWIPHFAVGMVSRFYGRYAGKRMAAVDAVVTTSPQFVDKMKQYNPNTIMVTNYPIVSEEGERCIDANNKYVCFAGGVTGQWMHDVIIQALAQLDDVTYVLAGKATEDYLDSLRSLDGWENVKYLGMIPHEEVKPIYEGAVAGMTINQCSQLKGMGNLGNTKLFECMEAGVPVICTDYPLWKEVVEGSHCGICVDANDVNAVTEAIRFLIDHPDEAEEMGKNGRRAVLETYNWDREKEKLLQLYEQILGSAVEKQKQ